MRFGHIELFVGDPAAARRWTCGPTRMAAAGTVRCDGGERKVTGRVWLDREWASNQLAPGQIGWDWFSLSLSDGSDLMLYRLRNASGTDPFSSGTLVREGGGQRHLKSGDFTMTPGETWRSAATGGEYPVEWVLEVPSERLRLTVRAEFPEQELALTPVAYWEGMIAARGEAALKHRGLRVGLAGNALDARCRQRIHDHRAAQRFGQQDAVPDLDLIGIDRDVEIGGRGQDDAGGKVGRLFRFQRLRP
jgi:hypothetical protein